jgi:hypothetical protein
MIPQMQKREEGKAGGDCLSACVATVLNRDDVPDFVLMSGHWFHNLQNWCRDNNVGVVGLQSHLINDVSFSNVACIEIWRTENSTHHAVVSRVERISGKVDSKIVHDPSANPCKLTELEYAIILQPDCN